ncbi:MAG TPA: hypothetical protein VGS57_16550 [Thermoanaerobaculia bacterium]|nr:hypothetical protein [Thermoanaerobaculia bacterium]
MADDTEVVEGAITVDVSVILSRLRAARRSQTPDPSRITTTATTPAAIVNLDTALAALDTVRTLAEETSHVPRMAACPVSTQ